MHAIVKPPLLVSARSPCERSLYGECVALTFLVCIIYVHHPKTAVLWFERSCVPGCKTREREGGGGGVRDRFFLVFNPTTRRGITLPSFFAAQSNFDEGDFLSVLSKQMLTNALTVHITVMYKRLVLTQTEALVVLAKQDSLAMV